MAKMAYKTRCQINALHVSLVKAVVVNAVSVAAAAVVSAASVQSVKSAPTALMA